QGVEVDDDLGFDAALAVLGRERRVGDGALEQVEEHLRAQLVERRPLHRAAAADGVAGGGAVRRGRRCRLVAVSSTGVIAAGVRLIFIHLRGCLDAVSSTGDAGAGFRLPVIAVVARRRLVTIWATGAARSTGRLLLTAGAPGRRPFDAV